MMQQRLLLIFGIGCFVYALFWMGQERVVSTPLDEPVAKTQEPVPSKPSREVKSIPGSDRMATNTRYDEERVALVKELVDYYEPKIDGSEDSGELLYRYTMALINAKEFQRAERNIAQLKSVNEGGLIDGQLAFLEQYWKSKKHNSPSEVLPPLLVDLSESKKGNSNSPLASSDPALAEWENLDPTSKVEGDPYQPSPWEMERIRFVSEVSSDGSWEDAETLWTRLMRTYSNSGLVFASRVGYLLSRGKLEEATQLSRDWIRYPASAEAYLVGIWNRSRSRAPLKVDDYFQSKLQVVRVFRQLNPTP